MTHGEFLMMKIKTKNLQDKIDQLEANQNQKAIECLKELKAFIEKNESPSFAQSLSGYWFISSKKLFEYVDNKIKELEKLR